MFTVVNLEYLDKQIQMKIIDDPINRKQSLLTFCAFILVKKRVYVLNTPYVFP